MRFSWHHCLSGGSRRWWLWEQALWGGEGRSQASGWGDSAVPPRAGAAYGLHDPRQVTGIPTCLQAFQSGELWSQSTQYFELINRINTWPIPQKARLTEQEFKVPPCPCPSCQERGRGGGPAAARCLSLYGAALRPVRCDGAFCPDTRLSRPGSEVALWWAAMSPQGLRGIPVVGGVRGNLVSFCCE